jgi:hypothetical protein
MNKTIALLLSLVIITSAFITLIPKVSSQQYYIPIKYPYYVGAEYSLGDRLPISEVFAYIWIPNGPAEHYENSPNYIHYYVLLNVNNLDPINLNNPQYWYQLGIDNRFTVVGGTYDKRNDVWNPCNNSYQLSLSKGKLYRFSIKMEGMTVVFSVKQLIGYSWITIWSCPQNYSTSDKLVLDRGHSVFEEVRANQTYEKMPTYSFYFTNLGNSERTVETHWNSFTVSSNPTVNPVPPNAKATINENNVFIQNYYNRWQSSSYWWLVGGASATKGSQKNTFLIAYTSVWNYIIIGKVTYKDPIDRYSKYYVSYETLAVLSQYKTTSVPSITYSSYTGKYYLAWRDSANKINVMQSYDGINWSNHVILNEYSDYSPTLVASDGYIYLVWVQNSKITVMRSQDGINWFDKSISNEQTVMHVGATYAGGNLIVAWYGTDSKIHVIKYNPSTKTWNGKVTPLDKNVMPGPSITVVRDPYSSSNYVLYLVWRDTDNWLNLIRSDDLGTTWSYKMTFDEKKATNPFIASNQDKLFITYCWNDLLFLLRTTL